MNKKKFFIIIIGLFFIIFSAFAIEKKEMNVSENATVELSETIIQEELEILNRLLDELFSTVGIVNQHNKKQPKLVFSNVKSIAYRAGVNEIQVSERFIKFATTTTVAKKEFIYLYHLGHELGHYYLFDSIARMNCHLDKEEERQADFYGVFTTMLAGHSEIKHKVDDILEALYLFFKPTDECYPLLAERQKSAQIAIQKADSLYQLFHLANHLSAINHMYVQPQYEAAIEIYDYLLQYYKGAEFYNNRGILYTHLALQDNYGHKGKWKRYFLPIEMDLKSKLGIIRAPEEALMGLNTVYFRRALTNFNQALKINPNQERYCLNRVNTLIFMRQYKEAKRILTNECWSDGDIKLFLNAIIQINSNERDKGMNTLIALSEKKKGRISLLAEMNLRVLDPDTYVIPTTRDSYPNWKKPAHLNLSYDSIQEVEKWPINPSSKYQYGWKYNDKKETFFVLFKNRRPILTTQLLPKNTPLPNILAFPSTIVGHNFESFKIPETNGQAALIVLGDQGVLIEEF